MADNDIAATFNSVSDNDSRKSVKRKFEEEKNWMSSYGVRKRYLQKKKMKLLGWDKLPRFEHDHLISRLASKIYSPDKDIGSIKYEIESKLETEQKYAIDFVGIWDATMVEEALTYFAAVNMEEDYRRRFVELVLKEQPGKNFSEALERVCKAWEDIRKEYTYEELFYDDAKSDKVKLEYCDWLRTEIKERDVTFYTFFELAEKVFLDFRKFKHSIDYVGYLDARTAHEALNWLAVMGNRDFACKFMEFVLLEQPEKSFWEALERVCKAWDDIRKVYTYKELFNDDVKNDKAKMEFCDWLTKTKTVS